MANCDAIGELVGSYIDDLLPAEVRRRVEAHLLSCRECAWETLSLQITRERLREHAGEEIVASDAFRTRTLSRLRAENQHLTALPASDEAPAPEQFRFAD